MRVPGALEIPFALQQLAATEEYDALIAIGAVIRGETYHFEIVSNESASGIMQVGLDFDIPIANAVLTTENDEQAQARLHQKGTDAAQVAVEMANIREHVSWIGKDKEANTNKAAELVRIAVEKLRRDNPLFSKSFESTKRVLVIGGGVAGIQAALDCADAGLDVLLVERESHIGGKMAKLDKTFPTVDCSSCILGPKMVDVAQHPKITLMAASEVTNVSGYVGNFTVTVKKKATYVDWSKCTGCGACMDKCPAKKTPDKFNEFVGPTTAINIPFPQAIPKKATINAEFCRKLTSGKCGVCAKVCPTGAINYEMKDEEVTETVGAIVAATGYDLMDWTVYGEYGAGQYPDVITSLQYERIMSASGPTGGHIKRPSDGKEPKSVVFIQCVGSRDKSIGRPY